MISGTIKAPVFEIENEKIINRYIFAVAISSFLACHPEVYDGDNQTVLLNEGGYELLQEYLATKPENLRQLLQRSIPGNMHKRLGIDTFGWVERLCGENGVSEIAVQDFRCTIAGMAKQLNLCRKNHDDEGAGAWSRSLRFFRCSKEDDCGKKSLIGFLVRSNVLPKYGFPVDTVELMPNSTSITREKELQLARDLQMAIADYAPGAQVVADGKMYTSRYIRRTPGKSAEASWEKVSDVPMHRPQHDYKTDDYYIGDPHRRSINKLSFIVNDQLLHIESTTNDSLVVIGQTTFKVCSACGYAEDNNFPLTHRNAAGYLCKNDEGKFTEYRLSHDFKTDVARITFVSVDATDLNTMLSVLYALLEGLSREMGIERTDIKGCLFRTFEEGIMIYSIVLYDAVAGGAGHVRRIVTEDGTAFQRVLAKAISVADDCKCDSSCYNCLRNYYNQKIHDNLSRQSASSFLHHWIGAMTPVPEEDVEEVLSFV